MQREIQGALEEVLAVEAEANGIVERARGEARAVQVEGTGSANEAREAVLAEARADAERIVATARAEAEAQRDRRLVEVDSEMQELGRSAGRGLDRAVRFVVSRLLGEEVEAGVGEATRAGGDTETPWWER